MNIIRQTESILPIQIKKIEERFNGIFVGDFSLPQKDGNWSEQPIAIFYNPNPNKELGHTHYFGIFVTPDNKIVITNGEPAFKQPILGVIADNNDIIYSRFRHDYRVSPDNSVWIDGGRDYCRTNTKRFIQLVIDKDKLVIQPNHQEK
ncbi:MAG: hypothetical protein ACXW2E_01125 [Nitrososphaeraceae archaeon]